MTLVRCIDIVKTFAVRRGYLQDTIGSVKAVDGVSLEIQRGEVFGLVGESGCGKTTLGRVILGVLKPDAGTVEVAAKKVQVIFQDPFQSLDPKMRVADIVAEGLIVGGRMRDAAAVRKAVEEAIGLVKLPQAALAKYPHQFSGGERQRIAIARAIVTRPEFIVCDEPVSSLDVTIELGILNLLKEIKKRLDVTYLFISHDLRVIKFMCDRVAVMRQGKIVEEAPAAALYAGPHHPYTKLLLSSILKLGVEEGSHA